MAYLSGRAVLGDDTKVPCQDEIAALAHAVATNYLHSDDESLVKARNNLMEASEGKEHALLDVAGVIGFFDSMTKLVDFTGHHSNKLIHLFEDMATLVNTARKVRTALASSSFRLFMALAAPICASLAYVAFYGKNDKIALD